MQCERCDVWLCTECLKMDDALYESINKRPDMHWYCKDCERKAVEAVKTDKSIEKRCDQYFETVKIKMEKLEEALLLKADKVEIDNIDSKVQALECRINGISSDTSKLAKRQILQESEAGEINKRKKNLILKGIPESDVPDKDKVTELIELIEALNFHVDDVSKYHGRLGKIRNDGKPRFFKIECKDEDTKKIILSKAVQIRHIQTLSYDKNTVYISPDMTILQRERDIELRKELKDKRLQDPNGHWIIRGLKVVKEVTT